MGWYQRMQADEERRRNGIWQARQEYYAMVRDEHERDAEREAESLRRRLRAAKKQLLAAKKESKQKTNSSARKPETSGVTRRGSKVSHPARGRQQRTPHPR
jgi:hypothetical protein